MKTVHEVSRLTGVSIRTLQYYDSIGLLHPADRSEAGYRLYDDACLETLQQILIYRELQFPLSDIRKILGSPDYDRRLALEQQIHLLELRKERLENLLDLARGIQMNGVKTLMNFDAFDTRKIDEYAAQAKAAWGTSPEYHEYEEKSRGRTKEDQLLLNQQMMSIFSDFGKIRETDPASPEAQALVRRLQQFITDHYYTCSDSVLSGLGKMYSGGGSFTANIDAAGGDGTAEFADKAIQICCGH